MKSLGKLAIVFTILFFVFLIPAIILTAAGGKMAAEEYDLMGKLEEIAHSSMSFVENSHLHVDTGTSDAVEMTAVYSPEGEVDEIVFDGIAYEIEILVSEDNTFSVCYDGSYPASLIQKYGVVSGAVYTLPDVSASDCPFSFTEADGSLTCKLDYSVNVAGIKNDVGKMTVKLPQAYHGGFVLTNGAGEIDAYGLTLTGFTASDVIGELDMESCHLDYLKISNYVGEIDVKSAVGSFDINKSIGDLRLELSEKPNGASSIQNVTGDINIELPTDSKIAMSSANNLGEVSMDKRLAAADGVPLTISNNIGEIEVETYSD